MIMNKKISKKWIFFALLFLLVLPLSVVADDLVGAVGENMCAEESVQKVMRFAGYIIMFVKFFVPLIIIGQGTFIFYNGVKTGKEDELKKCVQTLGKRLITGVIIILLPTIINIALNTIQDWTNYHSDYDKCTECLFHPSSC